MEEESMGRNPIMTPVRGDQFLMPMNGQMVAVQVDTLSDKHIHVQVNGEDTAIPWDMWNVTAKDYVVSDSAVDPCPNAFTGYNGGGHVGKRVLVRNLGRCYNRYRCLACGRTYEVDSSV